MAKHKSVPTFDEMLADITKFQLEIGKIAAKITNPRHKEVLGHALANVEKAKADFIVEYPKSMSIIQGSLAKSKASASVAREDRGAQRSIRRDASQRGGSRRRGSGRRREHSKIDSTEVRRPTRPAAEQRARRARRRHQARRGAVAARRSRDLAGLVVRVKEE